MRGDVFAALNALAWCCVCSSEFTCGVLCVCSSECTCGVLCVCSDYMDRFLDEQENQATNKERPASPINSLLYGDHKRHQQQNHSPSSPASSSSAGAGHEAAAAAATVKTPTQEEIAAMVAMVQKVVDHTDLASKITELTPDLSGAASPVTAAAVDALSSLVADSSKAAAGAVSKLAPAVGPAGDAPTADAESTVTSQPAQQVLATEGTKNGMLPTAIALIDTMKQAASSEHPDEDGSGEPSAKRHKLSPPGERLQSAVSQPSGLTTNESSKKLQNLQRQNNDKTNGDGLVNSELTVNTLQNSSVAEAKSNDDSTTLTKPETIATTAAAAVETSQCAPAAADATPAAAMCSKTVANDAGVGGVSLGNCDAKATTVSSAPSPPPLAADAMAH